MVTNEPAAIRSPLIDRQPPRWTLLLPLEDKRETVSAGKRLHGRRAVATDGAPRAGTAPNARRKGLTDSRWGAASA